MLRDRDASLAPIIPCVNDAKPRNPRAGSARAVAIVLLTAIALVSIAVVSTQWLSPDPQPTPDRKDNGQPATQIVAPPVVVEPKAEPQPGSPALDAFLAEFDAIKARGFVKTMRAGSTGIGYTLETLLGLKENNDRGGDFLGMEIKAYRDIESELNDSEKMNLFLKEPKWLDGLRSAERIREYGYVDDNGRTALYSTVTAAENSHGFAFEIDDDQSKLFLTFNGNNVGVWTFEILQTRLSEKHTEAVFVAAESRGEGRDEQFRYHTVTWCSQPSVESFIELIRSRYVMLELRMHVKENGSARNHGSAFRIRKDKLKQLYSITRKCR